MEKIDIFKVMMLFDSFKGNAVRIDVIGTILIPFYIDEFDWYYTDDEIAFGENEMHDDWFRVDRDIELKEISSGYDVFTHEEKVRLVAQYDIFTTYIDVNYDCSTRAYVN